MRLTHAILFCCSVTLTLVAGCAAPVKPDLSEGAKADMEAAGVGRDANRLLIVNCLLPGQLRTLGRSMSFLTPRRPAKVSAAECEIRGGEYVAYDRANFATSLKIWLPRAQAGDAEAQTYVGEIFEKGLGQIADPAAAAEWYRKAAEQGNTRAHINLGYLYESGLGVERNLLTAMNHYRAAAGFEDGNLEYVTSMEVVARKAQKQQIVDMEGQIATLEASNKQLLSERSALERQNAKVASLEREVAEKRKQVAALVSQGSARNAAATAPAQPVSGTPVQTVAGSPAESVAKLVTEIDGLEQQLSESEQSNKNLFSQLAAQQQQTSELRVKVAAANSELSEAREQLSEQQIRVRAIENRLADKMDAQAATSEKTALTAELTAQLKKEMADAEKEIGSQQATIARLEQSQSAESRELNQLLKQSEQRENTLKSTLDTANADLERLANMFRERELAYQQQLTENEQLQSESTKQLSIKQSEISALEQQVSLLQAKEVVNQSAVTETQKKISQLEAEVAAQQAQIAASGDYQLQASAAAAELANLESQLRQQRQSNKQQEDRISELEQDVANKRAQLPRGEPVEQQAITVAAGPMIEIIEPPVTILRGAFALPMPRKAHSVELIGRVRPASRVLSFKVNGARSEINANGIFTYMADIDESSELRLTAVDDAGERAELNLSLIGESAVVESATRGLPQQTAAANEAVDVSGIDFGNYHALIIGNQEYQHMGNLRTSVNDAIELERVLRTKFGFATELLQNANRFDILAALNRKRDELTENDNLLIYFAGHGELANGKGYWLPTDSQPDNTDNWISSVSVTDLVDSMDAKHVMIVADSCYSGTLSRSSVPRLRKEMPAAQKEQWYESVSESKVRTVFTSGGVRPVLDGLPNSRHSIFAEAFIGELNSSDGVIEAYNLFVEVQGRVRRSAESIGMEQDPRYSPIQFAGHESGEFLFVGNSGG